MSVVPSHRRIEFRPTRLRIEPWASSVAAKTFLHREVDRPRSFRPSTLGIMSSELETFEPSSLRAESPIVFAERNFASLLVVPGPTFAFEPAGPVLPLPMTNIPATLPPRRAVRNWRRSICLLSTVPVPPVEVEQGHEGHEQEEYIDKNEG